VPRPMRRVFGPGIRERLVPEAIAIGNRKFLAAGTDWCQQGGCCLGSNCCRGCSGDTNADVDEAGPASGASSTNADEVGAVAAPAASNGKVDEVGATVGTSNQKVNEAGVVGEPALAASNRNINQTAAAAVARKIKAPKPAASNRKAGKAGESKRQRHCSPIFFRGACPSQMK
jgi:hypothetical protein